MRCDCALGPQERKNAAAQGTAPCVSHTAWYRVGRRHSISTPVWLCSPSWPAQPQQGCTPEVSSCRTCNEVSAAPSAKVPCPPESPACFCFRAAVRCLRGFPPSTPDAAPLPCPCPLQGQALRSCTSQVLLESRLSMRCHQRHHNPSAECACCSCLPLLCGTALSHHGNAATRDRSPTVVHCGLSLAAAWAMSRLRLTHMCCSGLSS